MWKLYRICKVKLEDSRRLNGTQGTLSDLQMSLCMPSYAHRPQPTCSASIHPAHRDATSFITITSNILTSVCFREFKAALTRLALHPINPPARGEECALVAVPEFQYITTGCPVLPPPPSHVYIPTFSTRPSSAGERRPASCSPHTQKVRPPQKLRIDLAPCFPRRPPKILPPRGPMSSLTVASSSPSLP